MVDTFETDLQHDPERMWTNVVTRPDGSRHWHDLMVHAPIGYRPLLMSVSVPAGPGPHPTVIFIHGGAWLVGHPGFAVDLLVNMDIEGSLLAAGYAVAQITYRMSFEAAFPAQLTDCQEAVRVLRRNAGRMGLDPDMFATMGESAGGHLALLIGFSEDRDSAVAAVVDWYAPTDMISIARSKAPEAVPLFGLDHTPEVYLMGGPIEPNLEAARAASPVHQVRRDAPPVLIQHGTSDRLVPFSQAEELAEALRKAGARVELSPIEGADHCFWGADASGIMPEVIAFLNRVLRG